MEKFYYRKDILEMKKQIRLLIIKNSNKDV